MLLPCRVVRRIEIAHFSDRHFWHGGYDKADLCTIKLLLGHRSLPTTARYLHVATSTVCAVSSPLDRLDLALPAP